MTLLIVTDARFWRDESAHAQRTAFFVSTLAPQIPDLCVYYDDALWPDERAALTAAYPALTVHELPWLVKLGRMRRNRFRSIARRLGKKTPPGPLVREQRKAFETLCAEINPALILCTHPRMAVMLEGLPPSTRAFVDCHASLALHPGAAPHEVAEAEQERAYMARFEGLIARNAEEAEALAQLIPGRPVTIADDNNNAGLAALIQSVTSGN